MGQSEQAQGGTRAPIRAEAGGNQSNWWLGKPLTHQSGVGTQSAEKMGVGGSPHLGTVNLGMEVREYPARKGHLLSSGETEA
jgi:hypothetical protein